MIGLSGRQVSDHVWEKDTKVWQRLRILRVLPIFLSKALMLASVMTPGRVYLL